MPDPPPKDPFRSLIELRLPDAIAAAVVQRHSTDTVAMLALGERIASTGVPPVEWTPEMARNLVVAHAGPGPAFTPSDDLRSRIANELAAIGRPAPPTPAPAAPAAPPPPPEPAPGSLAAIAKAYHARFGFTGLPGAGLRAQNPGAEVALPLMGAEPPMALPAAWEAVGLRHPSLSAGGNRDMAGTITGLPAPSRDLPGAMPVSDPIGTIAAREGRRQGSGLRGGPQR